jgi:hypothetical protein
MSKKKHAQPGVSSSVEHLASADEYSIIGKDLARVILLNVLYLAAILIVYYTNHSRHYLEHFFSKLLHWY